VIRSLIIGTLGALLFGGGKVAVVVMDDTGLNIYGNSEVHDLVREALEANRE
jgi:hypothetical protein